MTKLKEKIPFVGKAGGTVTTDNPRKWYVYDGEKWTNGRKPSAALSKQLVRDLQYYWDAN